MYQYTAVRRYLLYYCFFIFISSYKHQNLTTANTSKTSPHSYTHTNRHKLHILISIKQKNNDSCLKIFTHTVKYKGNYWLIPNTIDNVPVKNCSAIHQL